MKEKSILILIVLFFLIGNIFAQKKIAFMQNLDGEFQSHQDSLVSALEDESYQVSIVDISETVNFDSLANYDLVIISRTCNSSDVENDYLSWAALTVPYLVMNTYCIRSNRLRLINSTSLGASVDKTDTTSITQVDPEVTSDIFDGVTTNSNSFNYYTGYYEYIDATIDGNSGQVLASLSDFAVSGAGRPVMIRWDEGVATYTGGVINAAKRTYMQIGSDDGPSNTPLNYENYTPESLQLFLNEIDFLISDTTVTDTTGYVIPDTVQINFNNYYTDTILGWNNWNRTGGDIIDAIKSDGNSSGIDFSVDESFTSSNQGGVINDACFPLHVVQSYYSFHDESLEQTFVFKNIYDSATVQFLSSRIGTTERMLRISSQGQTDSIDAANNYCDLVQLTGLVPDGDSIVVEATTNSDVAYINAVRLIYGGSSDTTVTDTTVCDSIVRIFPGAYGYGSDSRGAYAGTTDPVILTVDTLDGGNFSTGTNRGTLKWCLGQNYPRVIVFEVGGVIDWSSNSSDYYGGNFNYYSIYGKPYCNVYGQTAPSPGITITEGGLLFIQCHDMLIQHIRFRFNDTENTWGKETTCIGGWSGNSNIVIDHCSFSWTIDGCVGMNPSNDITFSNNIFAEPLACNSHPTPGDECHAMFNTMMRSTRFSSIRNIYTNGQLRAPFFNGGTQDTYIANNLMNNIEYYAIYLRDEYNYDSLSRMDIVKNYYRPGLNTVTNRDQLLYIRNDVDPGAEMYLTGNYHPSTSDQTSSTMVRNEAGVTLQTTTPLTSSEGYSPIPATDVMDTLFAYAGAFYWDRDSTDIRILQEIVDSTGTLIDSCSQLEDLYLNVTPTLRSLTIPSNPHSDSGNGYTNLEVWAANFPLPTNKSAKIPVVKKSLLDDDLEVYPNPNEGEFTISYKSEKNTLINIIDINGHSVFSEKIKPIRGVVKTKINLSEQRKGIYFVQVLSGKETCNKKIIIK